MGSDGVAVGGAFSVIRGGVTLRCRGRRRGVIGGIGAFGTVVWYWFVGCGWGGTGEDLDGMVEAGVGGDGRWVRARGWGSDWGFLAGRGGWKDGFPHFFFSFLEHFPLVI